MTTPPAPEEIGDTPEGDRREASLAEIRRLMLRLRRLEGVAPEEKSRPDLPDPGLTGHYYVG